MDTISTGSNVKFSIYGSGDSDDKVSDESKVLVL